MSAVAPLEKPHGELKPCPAASERATPPTSKPNQKLDGYTEKRYKRKRTINAKRKRKAAATITAGETNSEATQCFSVWLAFTPTALPCDHSPHNLHSQ